MTPIATIASGKMFVLLIGGIGGIIWYKSRARTWLKKSHNLDHLVIFYKYTS